MRRSLLPPPHIIRNYQLHRYQLFPWELETQQYDYVEWIRGEVELKGSKGRGILRYKAVCYDKFNPPFSKEVITLNVTTSDNGKNFKIFERKRIIDGRMSQNATGTNPNKNFEIKEVTIQKTDQPLQVTHGTTEQFVGRCTLWKDIPKDRMAKS